MRTDIDAAAAAVKATITKGGRQAETAAAMVDLLALGVRALDRIASALERGNEATATIAARRFNIDHL